MKGKFLASVALAALVSLSACGQQHCGKVGDKNVCGNSELIRTNDGRYGMWRPDGFWYWYMVSQMVNGQNVNHYYYGTGLAVPSTGGTWIKSPAPDSATLSDSQSLPLVTEGEGGSFTSGIATEEETTGGSYTSGSDESEPTGGSYSSGGSEDESSSSSGGSYSSGDEDSGSSGGSYSSGDPESSSSSDSSSSSGSYSSGEPESTDSGSYSSGDPE